jgi:methyl-accepting chemotaxis protein
MGNMIEEANEEVEKLNDNAKTMRDASSSAMVILEELSAVNQKTKEAMRDIDGQINVTNESAMKIKAATDIITDIAEETNLLSLNASIEAARAGEQGRGFAIVAGQIQKLAEQSNESARKIEEVINVLIEESQKSVETMEEVRGVIEKQNENVESTQDAFTNVNRGIDSSIEGIQAIAEKTAKLDEARAKVVDVVQNLTTIAQENASGTEETSSSAAEVGAVMNTIAENAQELNNIAREMEASVKRFIIE